VLLTVFKAGQCLLSLPFETYQLVCTCMHTCSCAWTRCPLLTPPPPPHTHTSLPNHPHPHPRPHTFCNVVQVKGAARTKLKDGSPLEVYTSAPTKHYPLLSGMPATAGLAVVASDQYSSSLSDEFFDVYSDAQMTQVPQEPHWLPKGCSGIP
jgi:hypothetical protein